MGKELSPQLISFQQTNTLTLTVLVCPAPYMGTRQAVNLLSRNPIASQLLSEHPQIPSRTRDRDMSKGRSRQKEAVLGFTGGAGILCQRCALS